MNLLEPVDARDFAEFGRNNGAEVIAALNIIKAIHAAGLNRYAVVRALVDLTDAGYNGSGGGAFSLDPLDGTKGCDFLRHQSEYLLLQAIR